MAPPFPTPDPTPDPTPRQHFTNDAKNLLATLRHRLEMLEKEAAKAESVAGNVNCLEAAARVAITCDEIKWQMIALTAYLSKRVS